MDSNRIGSSVEVGRVVAVQSTKQQEKTDKKQQPPGPGSSDAVPIETARAEVNAAALMTAQMAPTADGFYVIGSVATKVANSLKAAASVSVAKWGSSWGFWMFAAVALATS